MTSVKTDDDSDTIEGTVFELSEEELIRADKYEPDGYERVKISLETGKQAWIYMAG